MRYTRRRYVEDDPVAGRERGYSDTTVARNTWSPAQIVALLIGVFFLVVGGVALARTGLNLTQLFDSQVEVAGMGHSMLMAIISMIFGLLMIAAGAIPGADRGGMITLGVIALGFGLVLAIEPNAFDGALGVNPATGWAYVIAGIVSIAAGMLSPIIVQDDRRVLD